MSIDRLTRVNHLLRHEIAESIFRIINDPGVNLAALTVTRVEVSSNLRNARVYVSILGDEHQQHELLNLLKQHRKEVQTAVARHVVLKYTPHLNFELDHSIEEGAHVLDVIAQLEQEQPEVFEENATTDEENPDAP